MLEAEEASSQTGEGPSPAIDTLLVALAAAGRCAAASAEVLLLIVLVAHLRASSVLVRTTAVQLLHGACAEHVHDCFKVDVVQICR